MSVFIGKNVKIYAFIVGGALVILLLGLYAALPLVMRYFAWGLAENYEYISDAHVEKGRIRKAEKILLKAARKRPWDFRPRQKLGNLLLDSGRKEEALSQLTRSVELGFTSAVYPDMLSPFHRKRLANLYFTLAREEDAAGSGKPEIFFFTYAALLDSDFEKRAAGVFRDLSRRENLSFLQDYTASRFFSLTNMALSPGNSPPIDLRPRYAPLEKSQWTIGPLEGYAPLEQTGEKVQSENLTMNQDAGIFFKTGFVKYELTRDRAMDTNLWILAWGSPAFGIYPIIDVSLEEKRVAFVYVDDEKWRLYPVRISLPAGRHALTLRYPNDGGFPNITADGKIEGLKEDRNLVLGGLFTESPK